MIEHSSEFDTINTDSGYSLSREQVLQLTAELLEDRPPEGEDRFVCYMVDGTDRFANIARTIECKVFEEAFENNASIMEREYGPYEHQSRFFISVDRENGVPTGALRVIENGPAGLKSLNDVEAALPDFSQEKAIDHHHIGNLDGCWDIGTVAVPEEYRAAQGGVSLQLYRGMYVASQNSDIQHFVSVIDEKPYAKMTQFLGFPFEPLYGTRPLEDYIGSKKSLPVYGDAPEFEKAVRRKRWTLRGLLARKAIAQLGYGTKDDALQF